MNVREEASGHNRITSIFPWDLARSAMKIPEKMATVSFPGRRRQRPADPPASAGRAAKPRRPAHRAFLLTADGTEVTGPDAIGGILAQLTGASQRLEIRPGRTIVSGNIALCNQSWRLVSANLHTSFERGRRATFVLERADGRWQILVAAPWG